MSELAILTLRLEGAMQSWGTSSYWDYRATDLFPSKSGVIGLIACAMGLSYDDPSILKLHNQIRMAVRADRAGTRFVDFQTVTGKPLLNAEGKKRSGSQTIISRHEYLADASFLVAIEGAAPLLREIENALEHPRWPYYLGRKNCIPSRPLLEEGGPYKSLLDALRRHPLSDRADSMLEHQCEIEGQEAEGLQFTRSDIRASVPDRHFALRFSRRIGVEHVLNET